MPLQWETSTSPKHVAVSPSDITTYTDPGPLRKLYFGTGGTVVLTDTYGTDATYKNIPNGGSISGLQVVKVKSTGSSGVADIVGWY